MTDFCSLSPFERLPEEILAIIFSQIDDKEKIKLRQVSKRFYNVLEGGYMNGLKLSVGEEVPNYLTNVEKLAPTKSITCYKIKELTIFKFMDIIKYQYRLELRIKNPYALRKIIFHMAIRSLNFKLILENLPNLSEMYISFDALHYLRHDHLSDLNLPSLETVKFYSDNRQPWAPSESLYLTKCDIKKLEKINSFLLNNIFPTLKFAEIAYLFRDKSCIIANNKFVNAVIKILSEHRRKIMQQSGIEFRFSCN